MWQRLVLSTLCIAGVIFRQGEAKKRSKEPLQFVQLEYAKALSEYHRINATVLHVRATGGDGKISYSIQERGSPFRIDEKGHIWLMEPLNTDKTKLCQLTIKAISARSNEAAYAKVRFDIMNMNRHSPQFEDSEYICAITENTRKASILPPIRIVDEDHSDAGKLKRIAIIESQIPFLFNVSKDGVVEVTATTDLDAEKVTWFYFSIKAYDGGNPQRSSQPASVKCRVVDANEFAPEFTSDYYTHVVERGKTYDKILQVNAIDKDIGDEFGSVCKYFIKTLDVPFKINNDGVLSLDKPLGPEAPKYCAFEVAAVDCGGKISAKRAHVRININPLTPKGAQTSTPSSLGGKRVDSCELGVKGPSMPIIILPQCVGKATLAPDIQLNKCSKKREKSSFSALIHLQTEAGKGCDRQQYEPSGLYKLCGASGIVDILPKPRKNQEWTKHLPTEGNDGNTFIFNGKTVAEVPTEVIPQDLGEQFTVSTWIKTTAQKGKQIIVAKTDQRTHNRIHFAILKNRNRLIVVHRLEANHGSRDDYCQSDLHYKPKIFDMKWHHLTVVVDGCSVKLFVDGQTKQSLSTDSNYRMHKSHIPTRLVVGAHWLGKENSYTQFFKGSLSGLSIRPKKTTSEQTIRCMFGCHEHININAPLPKGFKSELVGLNTIKISGKGAPEEFEAILQNIEYQNELFTPALGVRKVTILPVQEGKTLQPVTITIRIERNDKPVITVRGCADNAVELKHLKEIGVPVCSTLTIDYKGCKASDSPVNRVKLLDQAMVKVTPPFTKGESFSFPKQPNGGSTIDDLDLKAFMNEDGIIIRGVANYKTYEEVLREMFYVNPNASQYLHHAFTISVSDQNGRFKSDKERLELSILHRAKQLRPFNLEAVKETLNAEELPGAVSAVQDKAVAKTSSMSTGIMAVIIICSASVFILLVIFGVYRLRKSAKTLEVDATAAEKEEMYWDDTGLSGVRITVNPLQKFQELDLNEDKDSEHGLSDDEDHQEAKQSLEWDEAAI